MLIGITGKAGSGKDTAGQILADTLGYSTYAFAWPLKRYCMVKFGLTWDQVNTQEGKHQYLKQYGCTVRDILQLEGTEHTKPFWGDDFWVKRLETLIGNHVDQAIVTDVRFDAEAKWVRSKGGVVLLVKRDEVDKASKDTHASEQGVSPELVNYTVANNGTLADLRLKLEGLFSEHRA